MEKKNINHARSKNNGIVFYSNVLPVLGSETFRNDSGQIQSRIIPMRIYNFIETLNEKNNTFNPRHVLLFDIILISICMLTNNFWIVFAALYFSITISFDLFNLANCSYQMKSKKGTYRSAGKYHAAEHMAINAYSELQRIPTLEEVKTFSRFSKNCGSRIVFYRIVTCTLISIAISIVPNFNTFIYFILVISIPILTKFADSIGLLKYLQVLVTNIPTDSELEVAIEGIKNFEAMEKKLIKGKEIPNISFPTNIIF